MGDKVIPHLNGTHQMRPIEGEVESFQARFRVRMYINCKCSVLLQKLFRSQRLTACRYSASAAKCTP